MTEEQKLALLRQAIILCLEGQPFVWVKNPHGALIGLQLVIPNGDDAPQDV